MVYCSDSYASDLPYWIPDPIAKVHGGKDEGMLIIPYSLCTNDHRCESGWASHPTCTESQQSSSLVVQVYQPLMIGTNCSKGSLTSCTPKDTQASPR
jgi:hypothetical protein